MLLPWNDFSYSIDAGQERHDISLVFHRWILCRLRDVKICFRSRDRSVGVDCGHLAPPCLSSIPRPARTAALLTTPAVAAATAITASAATTTTT